MKLWRRLARRRSTKEPIHKEPTMNTRRIRAITLVVLCLAPAAQAQFSVPWFTVDSGGGASAGGTFALSGTAGQPEAAPPLIGGAFKLEPGFWSGVTVQQTPGAPTLKIQLVANGFAVISWPVSVTGFVLEETASFGQPNSWSNTLQPLVDTAAEHTVTVPANGYKCYRLRWVVP